MNDLDKRPANRTRYGELVNRYLSTEGRRRAAPPLPARGLVLVGVDDSPVSCTAVDHAAIEAELHGWGLRILHVQRAGPRPGREAGTALLDRLTDRVHIRAPGTPVTSRLVTGPAAPRMLTEARKADLVVVGRHHGAVAAVLGFGVSDWVAADHAGAVLVVRVPGWPPVPDLDSRPIVVGVDRDDNPAVGFALDEARVRGCDVVLLHAGRTSRLPVVNIVGGVRLRRRFVAEDAATALAGASQRAAALVVGRRGVGGGPAGSLGAVTRAVLGGRSARSSSSADRNFTASTAGAGVRREPLRSARGHLLVDLPALVHRLLGEGGQPRRLRRVGVMEPAEPQLRDQYPDRTARRCWPRPSRMSIPWATQCAYAMIRDGPSYASASRNARNVCSGSAPIATRAT